jgi:Xaa-Pro aminopeptidase
MSTSLESLIIAEKKAAFLFKEIEFRQLIQPGKTERELNNDVYQLALELFGIKKYWHKRIVRSGKNTLLPYAENPENLELKDDDILFFDFGPVFDDWEADFGRTFVIGNDPNKLKLKRDVELAWQEGKEFFDKYKESLTGAEYYSYTLKLAEKYGWQFGNEHCGHLIGNFPHELIVGEEKINYIHPENNQLMESKDKNGNGRFWIYEIHFIDPVSQIGSFFEQLVS